MTTQETRSGRSEPMTSRMPGGREAENIAQQGYQSLEEQVGEHPMSAVLTSFGIGFGVGLALSLAIGRPRQRRGYFRDRRTAESIGQQILESISEALPESVARRMNR